MLESIKIAVIEEDRERALLIVDALCEAGDFDVSVVGDETGIGRHLAKINPDIVLIDIENPNRDRLESLTVATSPLERPVAMFVDRSDDSLTQAAIEAGVSAYVVDGFRKERIKPILDAAITRFNMFSRLRAELSATKAALAERKTIDRAKGLLMKSKGISEDEAYALLRKSAMDAGKKVADIASAVVTAASLLK